MRQGHSASGVVALQKPNGRVRGIVIGDFTRRLVARCFAQQKAEAFQEACSPFQFALSTRSGAERVVRLLTAALELDPESTIVSVDGVGAFDTMSRQAMLQGLLRVPGANQRAWLACRRLALATLTGPAPTSVTCWRAPGMPRMCPACLPGRALHVRVLASLKTALAGEEAGLRKNSLRSPCAQGLPLKMDRAGGKRRVKKKKNQCLPLCASYSKRRGGSRVIL